MMDGVTLHQLFCPQCFATDNDGSWGHTVAGSVCTNCGSQSIIHIPAFAVESIRKQASWVGKRYYPHTEDVEATNERQALLKLVEFFPGRIALRLDKYWQVKQKMPPTLAGRSWYAVQYIEGDIDLAEIEVMRLATIRYYSEEQLQGKSDEQ
jgi:hypothetical protein